MSSKYQWLNTVDPLKGSQKSAKLGLCFNTKRCQTRLCQLSRKQTKSHKESGLNSFSTLIIIDFWQFWEKVFVPFYAFWCLNQHALTFTIFFRAKQVNLVISWTQNFLGWHICSLVRCGYSF